MDQLIVTDNGGTLDLEIEGGEMFSETYDGSASDYGRALRSLIELHIGLVESDNL